VGMDRGIASKAIPGTQVQNLKVVVVLWVVI
jgi:hypothetical protein